MHTPFSVSASAIPALIKRNTLLLAASQSFVGAGIQLAYGIGPLMVIAVTGSTSLAGLTVGLFGVSRFLSSYPTGKITDVFGRKPGILFGQGLALTGSIATGFGMLAHSTAGLIVGMLIFTMGISAGHQLRVAATDMYPPRMRGLALGFIATGSLAGIVLSPLVMGIAEIAGRHTGHDALGLPWLMLPVLIVSSMVLVKFVRPDPKEIGINLPHYYPGYMPPAKLAGERDGQFSARELLKNTPIRLAMASNAAGQGNMAIVMVLTSLVLAHHGHSLTAIAISHMFHAAGMFAFTIPLGWASDRFGREQVMYPGVATTLVGALLVAYAEGFAVVTLGTFLVGVGWAAANVASTALIADHAATEHRGRAVGISETAAGAISVFAAVVTGPLIEWSGLPAAGLVAALIAIVPLIMLAFERAVRWRAG